MSDGTHEARIEDGAEVAGEDARTDRAPTPRMTLPVALVWVCAFAGLGAYTFGLFFPQ
jgi:hypothetical protein